MRFDRMLHRVLAWKGVSRARVGAEVFSGVKEDNSTSCGCIPPPPSV